MIKFQTKAESKKLEQERFMKLTGVERILEFLRLMDVMKNLPSQSPDKHKGNFVIVLNQKGLK